MASELLAGDEPRPFTLIEGDPRSPFVLACDHASNRIPRRLGTLGVAQADRGSHIAWDIGIEGLSRNLAERLGATLILCNYSRLVIDCNRPLQALDSIVVESAGVAVPGNRALTPADVESRVTCVFRAYHGQIEATLADRLRAGQTTIYVAMHSFTPAMRGIKRPWHVGVLYQRDTRMASRMLELLRAEPDLVVGDNEPYRVSDESDYSVITYGERRGLPHVELEVRQDLIASEAGQSAWAERLSRLLAQCTEF